MKLFYTFIFCFTLLSVNISAQDNILSITKESTGKEKVFAEGTKIRVFTEDGKSFKGRFTVIDSNTILVDSDTILLSNIDNIRIKNLWGILGGAGIIGAGGFISYTGINLLVQSFSQGDIAIMVSAIVGIPVGVTGISIASAGVLLILWNRNYEDVDWLYNIK